MAGTETLSATIGEQGQGLPAAAGDADGKDARLGVMLAPRAEPGKAGVTIAGGRPGERGGTQRAPPGRRHRARGGSKTVNGPADVASAVRSAASEEKPVLLLVERGDHRRYVAIELDQG